MAYLEVTGGRKLYGQLKIQGSKNAVLPILAASLLTDGEVIIKNCPDISDVSCMIALLENIGVKIRRQEQVVVIQGGKFIENSMDCELIGKMRASVMLVAPVLTRTGSIQFSYPGGCSIGKRPIDLHLDALKKMNVEFSEDIQYISGQTTGLYGEKIFFPFVSVGATEQVILAAVLAKGTTVIQNAAREPEIIILCDFLKKMGARISGAGTDIICIEGVPCLHGVEYTIPSDRIVTGTYMAAVAVCKGEVILEQNCQEHMRMVTALYGKMGLQVRIEKERMICKSLQRMRNITCIKTSGYPGFPTDMQSVFFSVMAKGRGIGSIQEEIFESRYACINELKKMGADITIKGKVGWIRGVEELYGSDVYAGDLRGGAALVVAGLGAQGRSRIYCPEYIERGYEKIVWNLRSIGADIREQVE